MGVECIYDVRPEQYANVIRDLIKHEDDVTNHRLMWLLIVQGLLVNAYVSVRVADRRAAIGIALAGIFVTFSAFVMLYKSYQARGYLHFLGAQAKLGKLQEKYLRLDGWPKVRIRYWRKAIWVCPWLKGYGDILEPILLLPSIIVIAWLYLVLRAFVDQSAPVVLGMAMAGGELLLFGICGSWVWSQKKDEEVPGGDPP